MAPRATDLGEIITYDRLGDYYLKEIILMRSPQARFILTVYPYLHRCKYLKKNATDIHP